MLQQLPGGHAANATGPQRVSVEKANPLTVVEAFIRALTWVEGLGLQVVVREYDGGSDSKTVAVREDVVLELSVGHRYDAEVVVYVMLHAPNAASQNPSVQ